jgi:hypothetical protein
MLEKLFGSKTRVKILKLFLLHPQEKYYIRQLSRDLKLQLNSVRRELENLENFGILTFNNIQNSGSGMGATGEWGPAVKQIHQRPGSGARVDAGRFARPAKRDIGGQEKKYYRANPGFVLFEEIKALIVKAQILYEKDFVRKLQAIGKIKLLVLTGIFVNNPNVMVDILVVGKVNKLKLAKLIKELEEELGREINFTVFNMQEFKYRRDITDIFLYGILEGRKLAVIDEVGVS